MSKHRTRPWIVKRHDPIEKLDDNLWTVQSDTPGVPIRRRMAIVKRSDGSLLFYHPVPVREEVLEQILEWGQPRYLVVGHDNHGIDAHAFRTRLGVQVYGPKGNLRRMRAKFDVDGAYEDIPPDPAVRVDSISGARIGEGVVTVQSGGGVSLVFCDVFQNGNAANLPRLLRWLGYAGGPKVPPLVRLFLVKNRAALRADFERRAETPGLTRLIPCHGDIVHSDAAGTLRRVAGAL